MVIAKAVRNFFIPIGKNALWKEPCALTFAATPMEIRNLKFKKLIFKSLVQFSYFKWIIAGMAELVDAHVSGACAARHASSSLASRTQNLRATGPEVFLFLGRSKSYAEFFAALCTARQITVTQLLSNSCVHY